MKALPIFLIFLLLQFIALSQNYSNWQYRQVITIDHTLGVSPLKDYQVGFVINTEKLVKSGKMQDRGNDIRIVDWENEVEFCYWIEGKVGERQTKIWVKIPQLGSGKFQQLHLLYGNPNAVSVSNSECTFDLFEDFDQPTLNAQKWERFGSGELKIQDSKAFFQGTDQDIIIRSHKKFDLPIIAEVFVTNAAGRRLTLSLIQDNEPLWNGYAMSWDGVASEMFLKTTDAEVSPCGGFTFFRGHFGEDAPSVNGLWSLSWLTKNQIFAHYPDGDLQEPNTLLHFKKVKVAFGVNACSADLHYKGELEVDWVRIRKFTATEPTVFISEEQEQSSFDKNWLDEKSGSIG